MPPPVNVLLLLAPKSAVGSMNPGSFFSGPKSPGTAWLASEAFESCASALPRRGDVLDHADGDGSLTYRALRSSDSPFIQAQEFADLAGTVPRACWR